MGYYPTSVKVYIDLAHGPFDLTETWTEITSYVTGRVRYEFGRSSAIDDFQPGKGSYTLINHDGRFDPSNASGPYYGTLLPRRRTKITATVGASTHTVAYGWVEGWPQRWEGRKQCFVDVTFTDIMSLLAQVNMPESVWDYRVEASHPLTWYKLGDTGVPYASDSSENGYNGAWLTFEGSSGSPFTGNFLPKAMLEAAKVESIIPSSDRRAVSWAKLQSEVGQPLGGISGIPRTPVFTPAGTAGLLAGNFAAAFWVQFRQAFPVDIRNIYSSTTPMYQPILTWGQYGGHAWELSLTDTGELAWHFFLGATTLQVDPFGPTLDDGNPHFIAMSMSGTTLTMFWDGSTGFTIGMSSVLPAPLSAAAMGVARSSTTGLQSTVGDVVFWDRASNSTEMQNLWRAGKYGVLSGTELDTDAAFTQGFTLAGVTTAKSVLFTDGLKVTETLSGQSFADYLRTLAATEQGMLFCNRTGSILFHGRSWPLGDSSEFVVWSVGDHSSATLGYADQNYRDFADEFQNDVTVSHPSGSERSVNAASVADYGSSAGTVDTFLASPEVAKQVANHRAWKYGTPPADGVIPDRLVIQPGTEDEFAMVCSMDIGHRIEVTRTRPNGTQIVDDYWVQSISQDFEAEAGGEWTTVVGLALADHPAAPFVLNSSLLDSTDALWI